MPTTCRWEPEDFILSHELHFLKIIECHHVIQFLGSCLTLRELLLIAGPFDGDQSHVICLPGSSGVQAAVTREDLSYHSRVRGRPKTIQTVLLLP